MVVSVVPQTANNMAYLQQLEQAGVIQFWGPEWKSLDGRTDFQIDSRNYPAVASHLSNNGAFPSVMISDLQEQVLEELFRFGQQSLKEFVP